MCQYGRLFLRSLPVLLALGVVLTGLLGCDVINNLADQFTGDDPCYRDGNSIRYTGAFLPLDNGWNRTANIVTLQFNTNCTDVYGYAEIVDVNTDFDRVETGTSRISFKGTYEHQTLKFNGTVFVDYDLACAGNCGEPYSFDYPANWNGTHNTAQGIVTGWIDGIGDFKLDQHTEIDGLEYKNIPGLDIWPTPGK